MNSFVLQDNYKTTIQSSRSVIESYFLFINIVLCVRQIHLFNVLETRCSFFFLEERK